MDEATACQFLETGTGHPASLSARCNVCGDAIGQAPCLCTRCQTPSHPECFAYNGGCAVYSCGSRGARFTAEPPAGWLARPDGSWTPNTAVTSAPRDRALNPYLDRLAAHWRSTAPLELFTVLGQAWLTGVALAMGLLGKWKLPPVVLVSLALLALAHANTLMGLIRVNLTFPATLARQALAVRIETIARSRRLHAAATLLLGLEFAAGSVASSATWILLLVVALAPWISLDVRWTLERPALSPSTEELEPDSVPQPESCKQMMLR